MMKFYDIEIPVAVSMLDLSKRADHAFQQYFCLWAPFNNIYTLVGKRQGLVAQPDKSKNGQVKVRQEWGYTFPKCIPPSESDQIREASCQLEDGYKDALIKHANVVYFVDRLPKGAPGKFDGQGQLINGVLNITRTIDPNQPVWSPIDKHAYGQYIAGNMGFRDLLAEQIIFLLYTVRNNLVHGSKSPDEANDIEVVENAIPLLRIVVEDFIR